jgi:hypothetical protein
MAAVRRSRPADVAHPLWRAVRYDDVGVGRDGEVVGFGGGVLEAGGSEGGGVGGGVEVEGCGWGGWEGDVVYMGRGLFVSWGGVW